MYEGWKKQGRAYVNSARDTIKIWSKRELHKCYVSERYWVKSKMLTGMIQNRLLGTSIFTERGNKIFQIANTDI